MHRCKRTLSDWIPAGVYARRGAGMTSARQAAGNEPKEIQTLRLMLRSLSLLQAFETHVYLIDLYY